MARSPHVYALKPGESVEQGFHRLLDLLRRRAMALAKPSRKNPSERIHEGRLLIKRLRSFLWFARPVLPRPEFSRARLQLRKAARLMAAQRDAKATHSTLMEVANKSSRPAIPQAAIPPKNTVSSRKEGSALLGRAMTLVSKSIIRITRCLPSGKQWPLADKRLQRAYEKSQRSGQKALRTKEDADFHSWRKDAKNLLYQLEFVRGLGSPADLSLITEVNSLQSTLGSYHDCVVAEEFLHAQATKPRKHFQPLLQKRKKRLKKKAKELSRRIFSSKLASQEA